MADQFGTDFGDVGASVKRLAARYGQAVSGDILNVILGINGLPITTTAHSHGYQIRGPYGLLLAGIESVEESQGIGTKPIYTVGSYEVGLARQRIRTTQNDSTLVISRLDLNTALLEEAFGIREWAMLADCIGTFTLQPSWRLSSGFALGGQPTWSYAGCRFTRMGRKISATESREIRANVTIEFNDKYRVLAS